MQNKIRVGILGLGRIGIMHTRNIATMDEYEIVCGVDPYIPEENKQAIEELGIRYETDPEVIFSDPSIKAVVICSKTETHSDFIIRAAKAGKDIFCEKPIDHNVDRILDALRAVREADVILQIGFMRRFDRHHGRVQELVANGSVGKVELLKITSRDPAPPTMKYISESGGIFVDSMIHDFDMARFLTGSEVTEVFATGTSIADPQIAEYGDFGNAQAILRFESGAIGMLETSRRSSFGHDQRVEVLGSNGCARDDNQFEDNVQFFTNDGYHGAKVQYFFPERYKDAYFSELCQFAESVINHTQPLVTGYDGLQAVLIAEAAARSAKSGKMEKVDVKHC